MIHYHLLLVKKLPNAEGELEQRPKENRVYLTVNQDRLIYGALVNGTYVVHEIVVDPDSLLPLSIEERTKHMAVLDDIKQLFVQDPIGHLTLYQQAIIDKALLPDMVLNPQLYQFPELYKRAVSLNRITEQPFFILEKDINNLPYYLMLKHYNEGLYHQRKNEADITGSLQSALNLACKKILNKAIVSKIGVVAINMEPCDGSIIIKAQDIEHSTVIPIQHIDAVDRDICSIMFVTNGAARLSTFESHLRTYLATGKVALLDTIQLKSIPVNTLTITNHPGHHIDLSLTAIWHSLLVIKGQNKAMLTTLESRDNSKQLDSLMFDGSLKRLLEIATINEVYLSILKINAYQSALPPFLSVTPESMIELIQRISQQNKQLAAIFANYQVPGSIFSYPELLEEIQPQLLQIIQINQTIVKLLALEKQHIASCEALEQLSSKSPPDNQTFFNNKKRKLSPPQAKDDFIDLTTTSP